MRTTTASAWAGRAVGMLAVLASLVLTACNTVEGAGKDIKSAGKGIEETAQDAKK